MKRGHTLRKKNLAVLVVAVILLLLAVTPALAGGWAVLTLDELPQNIQAGRVVTIGFMIRQHGITPFSGAGPVVEANHPETGQQLEFEAKELGDPGHYQAKMNLPEAGVWNWTIHGFGDHPMPDLTVLPAGDITLNNHPDNRLPDATFWLVTGLLATVVAGSLFLLRRQGNARARPWAWVVLLTPLLAAGLLAYSTQARSHEQMTTATAPESVPMNAYDMGQALFVAKGCLTCHNNDRVPSRYYWTPIAIGPDLSDHPQSAEYLRAWLKDPAALKPETKMPNLGLNETEIEALIAFVLPK